MKNYNARTLLMNADYIPILIRPWQVAMTMIVKEKAIQVEFYKNDAIKDGHGRHYPVPAVVVLKDYIRINYQKASFGKPKVIYRDHYTCQYCAQRFKKSQLTIDHVIPKSKWKKSQQGSWNVWTNVVAACQRCNSRKEDRTCEEAGMFPIKPPKQPSYEEIFVGRTLGINIPKEWNQYLSVFPSFQEKYAEIY